MGRKRAASCAIPPHMIATLASKPVRSGLVRNVQKSALAEQQTRGARPDQGRDDEEPQLRDRARVRADADERRADRARRIERRTINVDADQDESGQREADREPGEAGWRERMGDAENARQERKVATTSNTKAETTLYWPR
jgi:hypothetical protein